MVLALLVSSYFAIEGLLYYEKYVGGSDASQKPSQSLGLQAYTVAPCGGGPCDFFTQTSLWPAQILSRSSGENISGTSFRLGPFNKLTKITTVEVHLILAAPSQSIIRISWSSPGRECEIGTLQTQSSEFHLFTSKIDLEKSPQGAVLLDPGQPMYLNVFGNKEYVWVNTDSSAWFQIWQALIGPPANLSLLGFLNHSWNLGVATVYGILGAVFAAWVFREVRRRKKPYTSPEMEFERLPYVG